LQILTIVSGEYGRRNVKNIQEHGPQEWNIETWQAPVILPPVIDYPEDYIPDFFPEAELILSFAEHRGVAELIPEIAVLCKARAVIASVDNDAWLPSGLARQLREWLARIDVECVTPKPLCSLTDTDFGIARNKRLPYQSLLISEFARHFGQPKLKLSFDHGTGAVVHAEVERDAVCGCARHVAERLAEMPIEEVVEKAGLIHHHYPCLASMVKLPEFNRDTLMHESGNLLKDNLSPQVKPYLKDRYITPDGHSE
jgi:hypothetical protein